MEERSMEIDRELRKRESQRKQRKQRVKQRERGWES
jgi:hypothetical protein